MTTMKDLRLPLLTLIFSSAFLTLGKVFLFPNSEQFTAVAFTFPDQVPLIEWQALDSNILTGKAVGISQHSGGRRYRYSKENTALEIEMRYFVNTDGNTANFFQEFHGTTQPQSYQNKTGNTGSYSLFIHAEKAHLSACINPYGGSTVTGNQFKQNRNIYDFFPRLVPWLLGKGYLKDNRCLWAHLSIPLGQVPPQTTYQVLENAWAAWYPWWNQHFPR